MIFLANSNEITPEWTCSDHTCRDYYCSILTCGRYKDIEPCNLASCPPVSVINGSSGSLF